MADNATPAAQQEAIQKAEDLFDHVAQAYFEDAPLDTSTTGSAATTSQASNSNAGEMAWLAPMLQINTVDIATSASTVTPQEMFAEELRRYKRYDGGMGSPNNPLAWWKVLIIYSFCQNL